MTDANGEHKYIYDQYGNLINSVDPNGDTTVNAYDKNNNLIRSTEPFLYVNNLVLNSDFKSTLQNNTDTNRPSGWWGRWWKRTSTNVSTIDLSVTPDVDQTFGTVDFLDYVVGGQSDYYNGRLEGYIVPTYSESYTLYVTADDGVRVWFDGVLVIDQWVNQSNLYTWTTPDLKAGNLYKVVIEHYENTGGEKLKLEWSSASQTREIIPESQVRSAKYLTDVFTRSSIAYSPDNKTKVEKDQPRFSGNLALGGSITNSANISVEAATPNTKLITDGDISTANFVGFTPSNNGQPGYVQVDLGSVKDVAKVIVWHYYGDARTYENTKTEISEDGVNWVTIFDSAVSGKYMETASGKVTVLSPVQRVRYIRDYANGNDKNPSNHWVDIQAFDPFGQAVLIEESSTNLVSNGSFENISNSATAFASNMNSSASWTPLSGSFTFSGSGATSQANTSELKTGLGLWKPIVGSNGQPIYLEIGSWFTTPASVPKSMEVKLYQDPNNWYQAIWQTDNNFVIYKYVNGVSSPLVGNSMAVTQSANTSYRIVLDIDTNGSLRASILNGTTDAVLSTITYTDTSLTGPFDFVVGADAGVVSTKSYVYAPLPDGFSDNWSQYNGGFSSVSLTGGKYGSRALRMDRNDGSSPTYDYLYRQQTVNVSANTTYTLSADYMLNMTSTTTDAPRSVGFVVYFYDVSWNSTGNAAVNWGWPAVSTWSRRSFTFTTPANTAKIAIELRMSTQGTVYWDGIQLEQKGFATSFTDSTRSEEYLSVPSSALTSTEGTIELRLYVNSAVKQTSTNRYIFAYSPSSGSYANTLSLRHTMGNSWSIWTTNSANVSSYADITDTLAEGWHSFAVRWSGSELALFIDGQKKATVANPNLPTISPTGRLYLGKWPYTTTQYPNTLMDDIRISSRALTDAEILAGYSSNQQLPTDAFTTHKLNMDSNLLPEGKYFGKNTVKVNIPDSVTVSNYGLISDPISVIPNATYTLSAYIKGNDLKDGSGAFVNVSFYNSQDQLLTETGAQPFTGSFDWTRQYFTFTAPKEAAKVKVQLLLSAHGIAWFDGIRLEQGSTLSRYNVVPNPSMEKGTADPESWINADFAGTATHSWSTDAKEGAKSLSIYSSEGLDGDWRQWFNVKPNTTYTFTGWVKTLGVESIDAQVFGTYYLLEYLKEGDESEGNIVKKHRTLGNNVGTNDWKRVTYTFTTSSSTTWLRIGASLGNWGQAKGMVWFDGVRLFEGDITDEYVYDDHNNFQTNHIDANGHASAATYDLLGNKLTDTDSLGNTTKYVYDRFSRLVKLTDALGNTITFTYDVSGNKTSETDALGNTTIYQYDLFDRLVRVTRADGSFETYNYDAVGNRVRAIDALGNIYRYKYDGQNKLVAQINSLGEVTTSEYDSVGNLKSVTNAGGYTTTYNYDSLNRLVQIVDPLNHKVSYTYDPKGNVTAKTDANGNTFKYIYDYSGKLLQEVDALGNSSSFIYDEAGQVIRKLDANGNSTDFCYDNLGRLVSETDALNGVKTYTYDALGNLVRVTDQNGNTTTVNYDALKRLVSTVDALGYKVEISYDANGNRKNVKDVRGNVTTYAYDSLNRPVSVTDAKNNVITYTYDLNGNTKTVQDGRAYLTTYGYDALNRLVSVTDALNGATSYTYDAAGNRVTVTDPNGNITTMTYDEANRLTQVTDALGNFTTYQYDPNGNMFQETSPNGGVITSTYNANNWLTSIQDPLNYTESYTFLTRSATVSQLRTEEETPPATRMTP